MAKKFDTGDDDDMWGRLLSTLILLGLSLTAKMKLVGAVATMNYG